MKVIKSILLALFLPLAISGLAQDHDLIVSKKGDSIACHIDSITDSHIYFGMKSQNTWTHTQINIEEVSMYKFKAINRSDYQFKPGSSIIESAYSEYIPRNSIYAGIMSISYSRVFAGNPVGITLGIGVSYIDAPGLIIETTLLKGRTRHFFEPGIMGVYHFDMGAGIFIRAGYRYQGLKGFLFRAAPLLGYIDKKIYPLPALSLGYSF